MVTMNTHLYRKKRGSIVLELLIATGIFALVLTGIIMVSFGGQTSALDIGLTGEGLSRVGSGMEASVAAAAGNWGTFDAGISTTTPSIYTIVQTVTDISPCAKLVQNSNDWESEHEREQNISLQNIVVNTAIARAFAGGCSALPPGSWDNPTITGDAPDIEGQGTGIAAAYIDGTRYAFITSSGAASADDFWVFDTDDTDPPSLVTSLEVSVDGLNDIAVAGDYAYVVSGDTAAQFSVIDISDPAAPFIATTTLLANAPEGIGRSIFYYDDTIYIGTGVVPPCHGHSCVPTPDHEFHVFDVSDPTAPAWEGSYNTNSDVNDIFIQGQYAFLATSDDTKELTILDVEDPSSIDPKGNYDTKRIGGVASDENGYSVFVLGNYAYLGREKTNNALEHDFYVLNIANPANPGYATSTRMVTTGSGSGGVHAIYVQGNLAFIGSEGSTDEFQVWNVADPHHIFVHPLCLPPNYPAVAVDIDYIDDLVFIANRSNDAFRIAYDPPSSCTP